MTASSQKQFPCSFCPRKLKTEKQFRMHEATHPESLDKEYSEDIQPTDGGDTKTGEEYVEVDKEEYERIEKQAAIYDEIFTKCQDLEREIAALQLKHKITDDEMRKIDEEIEIELKVKTEATTTAAAVSADDDMNSASSESVTSENIKTETESADATPAGDDDIVWDAENKTVPGDWMFGVSRLDKNQRRFKSPEGFVFESRVKALEFMINSDTAEAVLGTMRLNLSDEGWYSDKSCPGKWKLRKIPGMKDYEYLSPGMEVLPSMQAMLGHMQREAGFTTRDVRNLEAKIKSIEKTETKRTAAGEPSLPPPPPLEEAALPGGWTKKKVGEATTLYISPTGAIVHTLQQVLASIDRGGEEAEQAGDKRKMEEASNKPAAAKKEKLEAAARTRVELSEAQLKSLNGVFQQTVFPDAGKLKELCSLTGLSQHDVKKWFVKRVNEEAKRRTNASSVTEKGSKEGAGSKSGAKAKVKMIDNFKSMTQEHKRALEEIFAAQPAPTLDMLTEVSVKLKIELNLLSKWFALRGQQKRKKSNS